MRGKLPWIGLAAGVAVVFASGVWWGLRMADSARETPATPAPAALQPASPPRDSGGTADATPDEREILRQLKAARRLPPESRNTALLPALEQTTRLPITRALLDELRGILDAGEMESCHYVLSLMEQREDKDAVVFLVESTRHADPDVANRALFALEAIAGTVFQTPEQAAAWAADWEPDADRAVLFAPSGGQADESPAVSDDRLPGPRSRAPRGEPVAEEPAGP
jgi:hypothetical protein